MRSSSEIAAEIRALKAQIASGMPYGNSAAHNAAVFDHVYSGDHSGIDQYNRAVEQAIQAKLQREATAKQADLQRQAMLEIARMNKADAIAERKQKEAEMAALKLAQARPEYMTLQKQMLEAVDAGNMDEAAIIKSQLGAMEAEHGTNFGADAQSLIDARQQALEKKKAAEEAEAVRRLKVANFLATVPTTFKNEDEKKPWYEAVNNSVMTPDEKAKEIERIRNIESGKTKVKKAVQGAVASGAGEDVKTAKKEREEGIAAARKALAKKASGRMLTKSEQDAIDKWGSEVD